MPRDEDYYSLNLRLTLQEDASKRLAEELHKINATLSKLMWTIIAGIALAFMQFVVKGGLNV